MARKKKQEEAPAGAPAWTATFADLMNLLLCFFVLLFAMSSTDSEKYTAVVESITSSFSLFSGGGSALDEGILVSSGVSQLNELAEYYSNLAVENSKESGHEGGAGKTDNEETTKSEAAKEYKKELKTEAENSYEKASETIRQFKLDDTIKLKMDSTYNFIALSIEGYFLFDSGRADLKKEAGKILDKAANVLKKFDGARIVIEGHTDNVPQTNTLRFKNNLWLSSARAMNVLEYLTGRCKMDPTLLSATGKGEYEPVASNKTAEGRRRNRRVEIKIFNKIAD